jgi:hypothetical protein
MAITHHLLVQVSAIRSGVLGTNPRNWFTAYALLGDDLVIYNDLVAHEYKKLISSLDMPYSEAKTHTSTDGFEFAKRWFFKGEEITGFSCSGLISVWKSYPLLLNFLENQESHGWTLPVDRHPGLILQLHKILHKENFIVNRVNSMCRLYMLFYYVRSLRSGIVNAEGILSSISPFIGDTPFANLVNYQVQDIICLIYLRAKRNLVEKDLQTFQREAFRVNAKLWRFVKVRVKEARVDHATADFLMETLSTVLNWNHPIVLCLNRLIDQSTEFLMNYWDPDVSDNFLFQEGLSKYHLTKGTFSMRSSASIMLAESAVLKEFITVARNLSDVESDDFKAINERFLNQGHKY